MSLSTPDPSVLDFLRPGGNGSARVASPSVSAQMMQQLVDEAACFHLFSRPSSGTAIRRANDVIGFNLYEGLYRFDVTTYADFGSPMLRATQVVGEQVGSFTHQWMLIPDDFVALPNRLPPPTPLDLTRSQRFVMLNGRCRLGDDRDGFYGFGAGRTLPAIVNGEFQLQVLANGTILQGFGRFSGHDEGTYVYCGALDPYHGFTGSLMLRIMDRQRTLRTQEPLPLLQVMPGPEDGVTYMVLRGEAVPEDPVSPHVGPDGKPIGLIVEQGLKLQHIDCASYGQYGIRALDRVGQRIGKVTAYVAFNPDSASGAVLDPIPFTSYDEFVFFDCDGQSAGGFTADSSEGRVFNTSLSGHPAIRFGGVGQIRHGTGGFEGLSGLMTDNSVVVFSPHVSASVYMLRITDREVAFQRSPFSL